MFLSFFGATKIVTGSNYLLEGEKRKILIDCGLFQGEKELEKKNLEAFPYNPREIDAVILTHAHLDHVGRLPKLVKDGFNGPIFATPATIDLSKLTLEDELSLQPQESDLPKGEKPLFSKDDLEKTFTLFKPIEYHQKIDIFPGISFKLLDAGHILGSAIIEIFAEGKKIVFSGDLGNSPTPLLRATEFPSSGDYILIESTYGDKTHPDLLKRKDLLEDTIEEVVGRKGVLMIPAFAIERTQELLYELNELVENHRIPETLIFVDSPLAIRSIDVYKKYERYYNKEASYLLRSGDKIFNFPRLVFTESVQQSKRINNTPPPKVIIAGSGMSTGGRILYHEQRYLPDPQNCLLLICYQVEGTRGRQIQEGAKEIEIFGEMIPVRAEIKSIQGYSAHADKEGLFRWLYHIKSSAFLEGEHMVKKVFVVHGEEKPAEAISQLIKDQLGIEARIPKYGERIKL
ncbi:MAG TPA: MBL fold metallo-hydrolase [Candidatus Pacearchaeota archaeon]|nr:MBL fold metallo-hydrolase [Candidatus Pacearchaeota archaeon]HOK94118.1 MBL fold metallo-hydrolase [Candidatus Pacearchaeota archaeon]HPO75246.1 MBL fold metallo-hydrolase [Candidatus Pacearchaeota archaeon]